jgi:hypothetical protein
MWVSVRPDALHAGALGKSRARTSCKATRSMARLCSLGVVRLTAVQKANRRCGVILVGLAYYPAKSASDKTFMRDVARTAATEHGVDVRVVSIAETNCWIATPPQLNDAHPSLTYVPRPFHPVSARTQGSLAHAPHGLMREYCERNATALVLPRVLKPLCAASGARYVHFFDNLGPAAGLVARGLGLHSGMTLLSSNGSALSAGRRAFWRASCLGIRDVIAGSAELAQDLAFSGVRVRAVIPWGPGRRVETTAVPYATRQLLVWTGPLGPSGRDELQLAAQAMVLASQMLPEMVGEVWAKPEYMNEYSGIAAAYGLPARVPGYAFLDDLEHVKVLISPIPGSEYVVGPPLTWLEAISRGCTIVTTPCRGLPAKQVAAGSIVIAQERSASALNEAVTKAWRGAGPHAACLPTADDAAARYVELWRNTS